LAPGSRYEAPHASRRGRLHRDFVHGLCLCAMHTLWVKTAADGSFHPECAPMPRPNPCAGQRFSVILFYIPAEGRDPAIPSVYAEPTTISFSVPFIADAMPPLPHAGEDYSPISSHTPERNLMALRDTSRFPTLITWTDPVGKTHIPPDPPLTDGYPPWFPRPNEYRREEVLKKCPSLLCRRIRRCSSPLYGKYCQKSHMEREEFRHTIIDKINRFMAENNIPHRTRPADTYGSPGPAMKRALQERQDECLHEALLAFQTAWMEKQKRRFEKRNINHAISCPVSTTR
jgi:hypothetical protein